MLEEESPFRPGHVVDPAAFVGREQEILSLQAAYARCLRGAPTLTFIEGTRGIGKTSLAHYVRRELEATSDAATSYVMLSHAETTEDAVRLILERLVLNNIQASWAKRVGERLKSWFNQVSIAGFSVRIQDDQDALARFKDQFVFRMREIQESLEADGRSGLSIILDEINGLARSEDFAAWIKAVVDETAVEELGLKLSITLCGYEQRRRNLIDSHPSLARAMKLVQMAPWTSEETRQFYRGAFKRGGLQIDQDALEVLGRTTGGIPAYAHEIGEAVWIEAQAPRVTVAHTHHGLLRAANVVGSKIFKPQVMDAIRSRKYRAILRKLALKDLDLRFSRRQLIGDLSDAEKRVLDNFLQKLKQLGAIQSDDEGGRGAYRFTSFMHRLYFWIEAMNAQQ